MCALYAGNAHADQNLTFGVYTSDKPVEMVKKFRPILSIIEQRMTRKLKEPVHIKIQVANNYEKGITDLVEGKVDFARFGPASYVLAKKENPEIGILAMESKKGKKIFYGILAVNSKSNITDVSQLAGKTLAFGDEKSTIGRYLSQQYLVQNGIKANSLKKYEYLQRHDKVGAAVGNNDFDAGALKESTFEKLLKKGVPLKELARFQNVTKPWIHRSGLSPQMAEYLSESLLEIEDPKIIKKGHFIKGADSDYEVIREAIRTNDDFFVNE
jgi:phosphonate transport system substrate-binding protein